MKKIIPFILILFLFGCDSKNRQEVVPTHVYDAIFIGDSITANWIKALATEKGYAYVDYHSALVDSNKGLPSKYSSDGCHPNQDGYTVMENLILPVLKK